MMSITSQAKHELALAGCSESETKAFLAIIDIFLREWDSGGAVAIAAPMLQRLIAGKPLTPLTGADDEWFDCGGRGGRPLWQNLRCSTVFKNADGHAYNIDEPGRPDITFPYWPERAAVDMPIYEMGDP